MDGRELAFDKSASVYGASIVVAHLVVNIFHGAAHIQLHIQLSLPAMLFVVGVILVCPLLAMFLLWTRYQHLGFVLLGLAMAGALVFGFYNHFIVAGADQVGHQGSGAWPAMFAVTAWLLAITEAVGVYIAWHFRRRRPAVNG